MTTYLLPPAVDSDEIISICKKAGVPFEQFGSIREFILKANDSPVIIGTMRSQDLLVLNRYASSLVEELPSVVMSAPGVVYSGDWVTLASAMPAVDWKEIVSKLSKSGHTAFTPESLEKRDLGSPSFDTILTNSLLKKQSARADNDRSTRKADPADDVYDPEADGE